MASHDFGGEWTRRKLAIVRAYLEFYTTVLTQAARQGPNFETWYIDAFAGTGDQQLNAVSSPLWDDRDFDDHRASFSIVMEGSARIALGVNPPFARYRMIESNGNHHAALSTLQHEFEGRDIACIKGEANEELMKLFNAPPWKGHQRAKNQRAIVFLDPYGLSVKWSTLEVLAASKAADVWYFFNLEGLTRNCPHDPAALDASKIAIVNEVFGTDAWRTEFYRTDISAQQSLFDMPVQPGERRCVDKTRISDYATERFRELFRHVSQPIKLMVNGRGHAFSLYCMSNNPSDKAISAIKRGVESVRKLQDVTQPLPAFHQTSAPDTAAR